MIRWLFVFACLTACSMLQAQPLNPVSWTAEIERMDDTAYVVLDGHIQEGWYVYSQFLDEGGPVPTEVAFSEGLDYLVGSTIESGDHFYEGYDDLFGMDISKYAKHLQLRRAAVGPEKSQISGTLIYMSCNDEMCLPPEEFDFTLQIP